MPRFLPALLVLAGLSACREPVEPPRPPYLAIVSKFTAVPPGLAIDYSVTELSGTLDIHRTISAPPGDTVILALPPASYEVELRGLPETCAVREGRRKLITLLDTDNTGLLRFNVNCVPSLRIAVLVDGYDIDPAMVYHVAGPGIERTGYIDLAGSDSMRTRGDTVFLEDLPGGEYEVSLLHVADNCAPYGSDVSRVRTVNVPPGGGSDVAFRVRCSDAPVRPRIVSLASAYHDGASAFVLRVADPDRDVTSYRWDITNCRGASVLATGARTRRGVDAGRTARADTLIIVGAFEAGLADAEVQDRCTALMVEDFRGNTSALVEQRIAAVRGGAAPAALAFNSRLVGTTSITTTLEASDADGDLAGTFLAVRVRDGVLGPFDGHADIGILSPVGFLDTVLPAIPLGGRIRWDDVYAVIVYLVDQRGNFTRLEDADLFR